MDMLEPVLAAIDGNFDDSCERLFELLRINSISTDPAYAAECRRAITTFNRSIRSNYGTATRSVPGSGNAPTDARSFQGAVHSMTKVS